MNVLGELQRWYESNCDDDWEHQYGIKIDTLDNPGWSLFVDLAGTSLADREFAEIEEMHSEREWIACKVEGRQFVGHGGPQMLERLISELLRWADAAQPNP